MRKVSALLRMDGLHTAAKGVRTTGSTADRLAADGYTGGRSPHYCSSADIFRNSVECTNELRSQIAECDFLRTLMAGLRSWRIVFFVVVLLIVITFLYGAIKPDGTDSAATDRWRHASKATDHINSDRPTSEKPTYLPKLGPGSSPKKTDEAYVTLQYGGTFFIATRVLGQSLRDSGTTRDMVALCMPDVPPYQ